MPREQEDEIIDAAVERALANLGSRLPPEIVANLRKSGRLALKLDPKAQAIVSMLRSRPSIQQSGVVGLGETEEEDAAEDGNEAAR